MKKSNPLLMILAIICSSCNYPAVKNPYIWNHPFGNYLPVISILLITLSLFYIIKSKIDSKNNKNIFQIINIFDFLIYAFWVMIPPLYFLVEYIHIFPDALKVDKEAFEDLKYTQELGSKVWAGFIVILTSILYAKYKKELKM